MILFDSLIHFLEKGESKITNMMFFKFLFAVVYIFKIQPVVQLSSVVVVVVVLPIMMT